MKGLAAVRLALPTATCDTIRLFELGINSDAVPKQK
jgi:hypothetical protein